MSDGADRPWLGVVPSEFTIEHLPNATFPEDDEWIAMVRAPEGLTVVREAGAYGGGERWIGVYGDRTSRDLRAPGLLSSLLETLSTAGIEVFVASTFHADLVLVPQHRAVVALDRLEEAGHRVDRTHFTFAE
jgi:hypothetical protein